MDAFGDYTFATDSIATVTVEDILTLRVKLRIWGPIQYTSYLLLNAFENI